VAEIGLVAQGAQWLSDYLDENIFAHLPDRARQFLMRASIETLLNAELCAALTGCADAGALLASFAEQNLFLQPLDGEWYRLHPIFQEFLARQLREKHADELPALHRTASAWFADHGRPREAFRHALESGDLERAASWAEQAAMRMVEQSDITTLLGWIDRLPPAAVKGRPAVRIAEAWALSLSLRRRAQAVLDELDAAIATLPPGAERRNAARSTRACTRTTRTRRGGSRASTWRSARARIRSRRAPCATRGRGATSRRASSIARAPSCAPPS
jgi:LuxR family maltose regulon positive regulatory protein